MGPSPLELAAMDTIGKVCEWTGMDAGVMALLCCHLWLQSGGHPRRLAAVGEEDITESKTAIKRGDEALKPGVRATLGESWRIARIVAKITNAHAEETAQQEGDAQVRSR